MIPSTTTLTKKLRSIDLSTLTPTERDFFVILKESPKCRASARHLVKMLFIEFDAVRSLFYRVRKKLITNETGLTIRYEWDRYGVEKYYYIVNMDDEIKEIMKK